MEKSRATGRAQTDSPSFGLRERQAALREQGRPEDPGVCGHEDVRHGRHLTNTVGILTNKKDGSRRNRLKDSK